MACVSMDMSDPTALNLCFGRGASWTNEIETRCPDCGAALVSRERVIREFEGSVRDPEASLPELSSLDSLCTTTSEDEQRHVRERLAEYDVAHFCFSEERAEEGSPAPTTSFYIAEVQLEWARDRLADLFRGGKSVLLARAANDVEALTYRGVLEDRDIRYTTSRLRQYPMVTVGPLAETLFFVAEADVEAARRAIEDVGNGEATTISAQEIAALAVPGAPPEDDTGPDELESSDPSTAGDASRRLQDLQDEARYTVTRLLLFLTATINLFLGAFYLGPLGRPLLGAACVFFGVVLVALGRWSRRNPETAFGGSLLPLILNVATMGPGALPFGLVPLLALVVTLFTWRRARARRLEG
jgi:hypothetical protein